MSPMIRWLASTIVLGWLGVACAPPPSVEEFSLVLSVTSDDPDPLAGAEVVGTLLSEGLVQSLGKTGRDGIIAAGVRAREGAEIELAVRCPSGHQAIEETARLMLRQAVHIDARRTVEIKRTFVCRRLERLGVLVVRAGGRRDLPIRIDEQLAGVTDAAGLAHVVFASPVGRSFQVVLDTTAAPRLRPSNPTVVYTVGEQDDIFFLDQTFSQKREPKKKPPRPHRGPLRIKGTDT